MNERDEVTRGGEPTARIVAPGFVAGVLGGVAMAAAMAAFSVLDGRDLLEPLRPLGDTFAGEGPRGRGSANLAYGLAVHLLFAGAVGVLMTTLLPAQYEPRFASAMGVGFALGVLAIMASLVLPWANPTLRAEMPALGGSWVIAHALYGAVAGALAQRFRQRGLPPRRTEPRAAHAPHHP